MAKRNMPLREAMRYITESNLDNMELAYSGILGEDTRMIWLPGSSTRRILSR